MSKPSKIGAFMHDLRKAVFQRCLKATLRPVLRFNLLALSLLSMSMSAHADIGATHNGLVSEFASFNTPGVVDGRVEAIAIDGDTVYVGGTFTQISDPLSDRIINQPYLFAYSKSSGDIIRSFDPVLDNSVLALEATGDGAGVFAGGRFSRINGDSIGRGLVKLTNRGDRNGSFNARTDAVVKTMVRRGSRLYVGGNFNSISGTPVEHLAAVSTGSGAVSRDLNFDFDGRIFTTVLPNATQGVDDIDITSDGRLMTVIGNFQSIDGISRTRLAVIELNGQAKVSSWNSDVYDVQCPVQRLPQYIRGVDIAPDNSYFVVGSQGFRRPGEPACDTIVRFDFGDLTDTDVEPTWVNYTGGDSVYEVVATDHAVYVGGHFRWLTNDQTDRGDQAGPGSQERRGLGALDPRNGLTLIDWRADRNPRGVGVFALIAEPEGLYIGDDTDFFNGSEHRKLKFLPLTDDTIVRPDEPTLPTTIFTPDGRALDSVSFNGSNFGSPVELSNSGWENSRGGVFVGGQLFHADSAGNMWVSEYMNGSFAPRTRVDLFGLTDDEWEIGRIGGMFFEYEQSRVYYTKRGDSRLYYRAFTPDGPYFGNDEFLAEDQGDIPWGSVRGMDIVDGNLYFGRSDGSLNRTRINGASVVRGNQRQIRATGWGEPLLAFLSRGQQLPGADDAETQFVFNSFGSQTNGRFRTFEFPVVPGRPTVVQLEWPDRASDLRLFVRDPNGVLVASDGTTAGSPKTVTAPAGNGGIYTASVLVAQGDTLYTLSVNPDNPAPGPEPAPTPGPAPGPAPGDADFVFSASGTDNTTNGRFQVFNFDVARGEQIEGRVNWNDREADVRVFLRNENGVQIDRNTDGTGSATVSATAQTSGRYSLAVLIRDARNTVDYDVLIDTTRTGTPAPVADFEFSSSGTDNVGDGRFQSFGIDVQSGDRIESMVTWNDSNADVRVFLRDETGAQIDRNADGRGSATVSARAGSSGRWTVSVWIRTAAGRVRYDGQVNVN